MYSVIQNLCMFERLLFEQILGALFYVDAHSEASSDSLKSIKSDQTGVSRMKF